MVTKVLRERQAHPAVIAVSKKYKCSACQESSGLPWKPVVQYEEWEPNRCIGADHFYWRHPYGIKTCRGTLVIDRGSRAIAIRIWREKDADRFEELGNGTSLEMEEILSEWFRYYGRPEVLKSDPDGCFRDLEFKRWCSERYAQLDPEPGESHWRTGWNERYIGTIKNAATRTARRVDPHTSCQDIFSFVTEAHQDLSRTSGYSPLQRMIGRTPKGVSLTAVDEMGMGELTAPLLDGGLRRA